MSFPSPGSRVRTSNGAGARPDVKMTMAPHGLEYNDNFGETRAIDSVPRTTLIDMIKIPAGDGGAAPFVPQLKVSIRATTNKP